MASRDRASLVGLNHIALEVDDVDEAIAFYGRLFDFRLRGRAGPDMAFVDAGDQFIALSAPRRQPPDRDRHIGVVVTDKAAVRAALEEEEGVEVLPGRRLDFLDPWGNRIEVVQYDQIQFTKTGSVLAGMGLAGLGKTPEAEEELRRKGLA
jgi:catechol 2,3-dioxygenase-like lactoylglutathione lyase family enzyme